MNGRRISFGFLSSAPPTPCGLATFTAALASNLERMGNIVSLVRVLDKDEALSSSKVPIIGRLVAANPLTIEPATKALNQCDVVLVQHEYGLYGGSDGEDILKVLNGLHVPTVAILHTVLSRPTEHQREVLNEVIKAVDVVVVMTTSASKTLEEGFENLDTPVSIIAHGAALASERNHHIGLEFPTILTWGLIGPGKGIEWVIDAMMELKELQPTPVYVVAGKTHPKVFSQQGESYRMSLRQRAHDNGVADLVTFDDTYRDVVSLTSLIESADVVVLPYDSKDQATSGVLVDAIAAGRPVVATAFPHAVELLSTGAGIVVPSGDAKAIAGALSSILSDHELAESMANEARHLGDGLSWHEIAKEYHLLADHLLQRVDVLA
jgi:glycosyltransferase involved in cell wall biosynthesis